MQADVEEDDVSDIDLNDDGMLEYREVLQAFCTCDVELNDAFDDLSGGGDSVSFTLLVNHDWANDYDFKSVSLDKDDALSDEELDLLMVLCETTFDAFDGDGDGVPTNRTPSRKIRPKPRTRMATVWATTQTLWPASQTTLSTPQPAWSS